MGVSGEKCGWFDACLDMLMLMMLRWKDDENNENRGEREMDVIPRVFVADNCRF